MKDKIETYIGFCIKSRKIIIGVDALGTSRKKVYCILICNTLSENSLNSVKKIGIKLGVPVIKVLNKSLEEISFIKACRVLALTDKELAKAVMENLNSDYEILKD